MVGGGWWVESVEEQMRRLPVTRTWAKPLVQLGTGSTHRFSVKDGNLILSSD